MAPEVGAPSRLQAWGGRLVQIKHRRLKVLKGQVALQTHVRTGCVCQAMQQCDVSQSIKSIKLLGLQTKLIIPTL